MTTGPRRTWRVADVLPPASRRKEPLQAPAAFSEAAAALALVVRAERHGCLFSRRGCREAAPSCAPCARPRQAPFGLELVGGRAALGIRPDCYFVVHRSEQAETIRFGANAIAPSDAVEKENDSPPTQRAGAVSG